MRQEVYRVAYDEASAELGEILAKFEQLRLRKDRVEKVVDALKPLVVAFENGAAVPASLNVERAPMHVAIPQPAPMEHVAVAHVAVAAAPVIPQQQPQPAPSPIPYPVQQAVEEVNDPFARRVENAIGLGSAARDVREYSRLFSTGTGR